MKINSRHGESTAQNLPTMYQLNLISADSLMPFKRLRRQSLNPVLQQARTVEQFNCSSVQLCGANESHVSQEEFIVMLTG